MSSALTLLPRWPDWCISDSTGSKCLVCRGEMPNVDLSNVFHMCMGEHGM